MLGIRTGYYSDDPKTCWKIDSIVDFMEDSNGAFFAYFFPDFAGKELTDDAAADKWLNDFWGKVLPIVEKRLKESGSGYIAGTSGPTIADFKTYQPVMESLHNPASPMPGHIREKLQALVDSSEHFARWADNMKTQLQSFLDARP